MTHEVNTEMNKIASHHQVRLSWTFSYCYILFIFGTNGTISYSVINVQATLCPQERYNSVHDEF